MTSLNNGATKAGENRVSYKGIFHPQHPEKYVGDATKIVWRSLMERRLMDYLDKTPSILNWASEECTVPYVSPLDNRIHLYYPDFVIKRIVNGEAQNTMIEVKPSRECVPPTPPKKKTEKAQKRFLRECITYSKNQAKWEAAKIFCKKNNLDFLVITEKSLNY
jgi:hypothetical protein